MPLRPYEQEQMFLLPPSLNEWVRADNPARVFSEIIDRLDTTTFRQPKEEGRPAYHPAMMIKVLIWGYATGVRSSRKIEEKLEQDVVFMWLAGLEKPDFRTLCLFRTNNKEALEKIFTDVIIVAKTMGMATLGLVALDGSKVRANSGIDTFKKLLDWKELLKEAKEEAQRIISEAENIDKEEDKIHGDNMRGDELPKEIEKAQDRIEKIEALIKKAKELGKEDESRISLTDADASFMHKGNTSMPAFNAQLAVTKDQLIVYADVTAEPVDVNQTKKVIEGIKETAKEKPKIVVADTGYSGGENLRYLEDNKIDGYIPSEDERHIGSKKRQKAREHSFAKEIFMYDAHKDKYTCPQGETLRRVSRTQFKSKYSKREIITYRTERGTCTTCPLREKCTTDIKSGRAITRDGYEEYRERMKEKLSTSEGRSIYGKRKCIVEPVFGQIKTRNGFGQFLLRGLEKVRLEWKIVAIAHNLLKMTAAIMRKERILPALG
ncbi:MAG: IS1182 family transposase [Nitrospirota bacterium]|nr:IS1182 family transposase [Nitrospirota bacterium]